MNRSLLILAGLLATSAVADEKLRIIPAELQLHGKDANQLLIVMKGDQEVTDKIKWHVQDAKQVRIDNRRAFPMSDGKTTITAELQGERATASVTTKESKHHRPVSFELEIQPILTAAGCNSGPCHGKARGQNGFQLSLLGFDSDFDFNAITREARGRRIFPSAPEKSLLLQKPAGQSPHGGGIRLPLDSFDYQTILRWLQSGTPREIPNEPKLDRISVRPSKLSLKPKQQQQLVVTAFYTDGSSRDVTGQTTFQSNESAIVAVNKEGTVKAGPIPGEATIMARFMGVIATSEAIIPLPGKVPDELYAKLPRYNFIDGHVWNKLQLLGITPSAEADQAKIMRRVYLDIIGRLPTPEELNEYLADKRPERQKRSALIDNLLQRPEYADHWANKWADLLRPNPYRVGIKAVLNYDNWIRGSFRENKPYDQFVRELVSAEGSTWRNGSATLFRDRRSPDEITTLVTQLFLGIRLECAKCHHHPFEKWGQDDFYSFAAYFARVGRKGTGLSPQISGGEEIVMTGKSGDVRHPLTNQVLAPRPLFGKATEVPDKEDDEAFDRRVALAKWITSKDNPYFAQVMANRVWADLMGRGLVEPVDDLRATNPPSNGPLLEALAKDFADKKFNIKELLRTVTSSYVYGLSSLPNDRNVADTRNYSRHYRSRLRAEVLLDAISDITNVPESFSAMPAKSRANQIWTHRVSSLFLDTFGRPDPNQDPPCERTGESTVTQTLHLMNAPQLHKKVTNDSGRAAELAKSKMKVDEIVSELYLRCYSRFPTDEELTVCREIYGNESNRRRATEDILWALVNTPEFMFKD